MSTGLKAAMGVIGVGAMLALGISASEPSSSTTVTPNAEASPKSEGTKPLVPTKIAPKPHSKPTVTETKPVSNCHPSYSGCLEMNAGDYDCAGGSGNGPNYTGTVRVYDSDPFDLDRDNDGWGCE